MLSENRLVFAVLALMLILPLVVTMLAFYALASTPVSDVRLTPTPVVEEIPPLERKLLPEPSAEFRPISPSPHSASSDSLRTPGHPAPRTAQLIYRRDVDPNIAMDRGIGTGVHLAYSDTGAVSYCPRLSASSRVGPKHELDRRR